MPDVLTMMQLAEQLRTRVETLLADPEELPGEAGRAVREASGVRRANKGIIQALSSTLVWFVALLIFVVGSSFGIKGTWLAFCYAVPANAIVLLSLRSAWRMFSWNQALISGIAWGCLLSIHMTLWVVLRRNIWKIYLLGIPGQIAIFLWFRMFRPAREDTLKEE